MDRKDEKIKEKQKIHLWEVEHPYYCNQNNYFSNDCNDNFSNWDNFYEEYSDADMDMNLIFRWDWVLKEGTDAESDELRIYWIGQRKGLFRSTTIDIKKEDESKVIKYLKPRLAYLFEMWEPLNGL